VRAWHTNGSISLWLDGELKQTVSGIDNDTLRIEKARLGPSSGLDAGTSGTEYFDAFESRRQTYIGPVGAGGSLATTVITYTYDPLSRLTGASYSGAYTYTFAYRYDAVGNRTVQTRTITSTLATTYIPRLRSPLHLPPAGGSVGGFAGQALRCRQSPRHAERPEQLRGGCERQ